VIAAPDFENGARAGASADPSPGASRRSRDLAGMRFEPLPGTEAEGRAVADALGVKPFLGQRASETLLRELQGPAVLHVATHGFFLPDQSDPASPASENPLLRSGLAFAGANGAPPGADDGILTAFEMAGLDLWGTRLVVLSACETAVGEASVGEGVYGMRRALVIAGAESQLASLWKVDDLATQQLMTDYYKRLRAGEGRSAALRNVQLSMLAGGSHAHPFFWASFIPIGARGPIDFASAGEANIEGAEGAATPN
jgi:CHAT domain-containing protein